MDDFLNAVGRPELRAELSVWKQWRKLRPASPGGRERIPVSHMAEFRTEPLGQGRYFQRRVQGRFHRESSGGARSLQATRALLGQRQVRGSLRIQLPRLHSDPAPLQPAAAGTGGRGLQTGASVHALPWFGLRQRMPQPVHGCLQSRADRLPGADRTAGTLLHRRARRTSEKPDRQEGCRDRRRRQAVSAPHGSWPARDMTSLSMKPTTGWAARWSRSSHAHVCPMKSLKRS